MLKRFGKSILFTQLIKPLARPLYWAIKRAQRQAMRDQRDRDLEPTIQREAALLNTVRRQHPDERYLSGDPLVTVAIPTYQRGQMLVNRTLPAILKQTYANLDVMIVGDHCTDDTPQLLADYPDKRVRFYNLPTRPTYPTDPQNRWRVAGVPPVNKALEMAQGDWIAHTDDDDIWTLDHIEALLRFAQQNNLEFVYGVGRLQVSENEWVETGKTVTGADGRLTPFVSHSAVLYRAYLRVFPYDIEAWKYHQGADANRWMRLHRAGVRMGFLDQHIVDMPLRPQEVKREFNTPQ